MVRGSDEGLPGEGGMHGAGVHALPCPITPHLTLTQTLTLALALALTQTSSLALALALALALL